jgi:hypothetical protein
MRVLGILTVKDEASFLLEWLAHHRAAGFTDFLVFSNDCSDGTDAMLDRLAAMGWLTHIRNEAHPKGPQWAALNAAERHPLVAAADWIMVLDVDEFVNIHAGDRTVAALLAAVPQATAITLTWRMFGNGGVVGLPDAPVTETFTQAAGDPLEWPWRAVMYKTLFANTGTPVLGVHRPKGNFAWVDSAGRSLNGGPQRIFSALGAVNYTLAQLNHYAIGSMEGYLVKAARGRANRDASAFDLGYWVERNLNHAVDRSILSMPQAALRAEVLAGLLADPALGALHHAGQAWRKARFLALMQDEAWRALFGRLLMATPSRALTAAQARLVWSHALPRG